MTVLFVAVALLSGAAAGLLGFIFGIEYGRSNPLKTYPKSPGAISLQTRRPPRRYPRTP